MSFSSTHWSVVRAAGGDDSQAAREAFAVLFETYTPPLHAYLRRQGCDADDARDLIQSFFASLIERRDLQSVQPDRGRFRAFLLASLRHFFLNELGRARAHKRGGAAAHEALDAVDAQPGARGRHVADPAETPERAFDRQWALTTLEQALARVRRQWREAGKLGEFDRLAPLLTGEDDGGYAAVARDLRMTPGAARVAVHRLRRRFRDALRDEIGKTVAAPEDVDVEIAYLRKALRP